ncbi:hypothetical protein [Nitrosovibrio sp. Nv6]|uniref:hypothetical protein n=1 Tax=Nitrosovibrio sp. Nv6 TaxID=1855340 RepID=UPI0008CF7A4C|nr:hypothetical protein [Nitrosovibrio sp. Nv6]SEP37019.1 hypothetical protein SAMN05216316_2662 [Nitrosovibrio sp. Nv6]
MEDEVKPGKNVGLANGENPDEDVLDPWNEELQQSYQILKSVLNILPPESRGELVELLQIIAEDCVSRKSQSSLASTAEQIIARICRDDNAHPGAARREPERRAGERRQGERRQRAYNSYGPWTAEHIRILEAMVSQNVPIRRIALKLGRTSGAVEAKAKELNVPLPSIE